MSLHDKIMNLSQSVKGKWYEFGENRDAYAAGHRDARHAAAELAGEADARIAELEGALRALLVLSDHGLHSTQSLDLARAALAAAKEQQ